MRFKLVFTLSKIRKIGSEDTDWVSLGFKTLEDGSATEVIDAKHMELVFPKDSGSFYMDYEGGRHELSEKKSLEETD